MDRYSFSPNLQAIPLLCAVLFPFWLDGMHKVSQFLSHEKIDLGNYLISEYLCTLLLYLCRVVFNSIPISYMAIPSFPYIPLSVDGAELGISSKFQFSW